MKKQKLEESRFSIPLEEIITITNSIDEYAINYEVLLSISPVDKTIRIIGINESPPTRINKM